MPAAFERLRLTAELIKLKLKNNDPAGAREIAASLSQPYLSVGVPCCVAAEMARTRNSEGYREWTDLARTAADALKDDDGREKAYRDIAASRANANDPSGAQQMLDLIKNKPLKVEVMANVAYALAKAGDKPGYDKYMNSALDLLASIPEADLRRQYEASVSSIAHVQAQVGDVPGFTASLRMVPNPAYRPHLCEELARTLAYDGKLDALAAWIDTLQSPAERAHANYAAAQVLIYRKWDTLRPNGR